MLLQVSLFFDLIYAMCGKVAAYSAVTVQMPAELYQVKWRLLTSVLSDLRVKTGTQYPTSQYLTSQYLTSQYPTSQYLTSQYLTSQYLTSVSHLSVYHLSVSHLSVSHLSVSHLSISHLSISHLSIYHTFCSERRRRSVPLHLQRPALLSVCSRLHDRQGTVGERRLSL